jgi:Zn-dependent M28 family amino/carboxypeptidase
MTRSLLSTLVALALPALCVAQDAPAQTGVAVDVDRLKKTVKVLCALEPARNHRNLESLDKAAAYVKAEFKRLEFDVREQEFQVSGKTYRNVIARVGPQTGDLVVIGAHYDVCGDQPGADDNASGVAGLLEVARLLKTLDPKLRRPVELVAYSLEEPPHFATKSMGGYVHAKSLVDAKVKVRAMLCLEMIGYFSDAPGSQEYPDPRMARAYPSTANFISVVGNLPSGVLTKQVQAAMKAAGSVDVQALVAPPQLREAAFSDHRNYWGFQIPAVMISDTSFFRSAHYHQKSDTPKTLDFSRMAEVVKGTYAALVGLAQGA